MWGNKLFSISVKQTNTLLCFRHWISCGVFLVKDILNDQHCIDEDLICQKIQRHNNIYVEIIQVKQAVNPVLSLLRGGGTIESSELDFKKEGELSVEHFRSREIYKNMVIPKLIKPTFKKWEDFFNITLDSDAINKTIAQKITDIKDTKIKEFNFKVLYSILVSRSYLSKWQDINPNCEICNTEDNIAHMLLECELANFIWEKSGQLFETDPMSIILGSCEGNNINECISVVEYILYKYFLICKEEQKNRNLRHFKAFCRRELSDRSIIYHQVKCPEISNFLVEIKSLI